MTAKIESNFGREIMKNIDAQWMRIENRHGGGIPDLYGIRDGVSIWLELKCVRVNSINISPLQISWNDKHFQENGKNYFLVKHTEQRIIKLYDGDKGRELKEHGFEYHDHDSPTEILDYDKRFGGYDWRILDDQLFS